MPVSMNIAKANKFDDFYTLMPDIEKELSHYKRFFSDKIVYCCCDNPGYSNFYKYFKDNFRKLNLKLLIASYKIGLNLGCCVKYNGIEEVTSSNMDGSIESPWFCSMVAKSDIVVTNPPFSKSKKLILYLVKHNKKFILVGNRNHITSDKMFSLFMENKIRLGYGFEGATGRFLIPQILYGHYSKDVNREAQNLVRFRNVVWYTNLDVVVPPKVRCYTKKYDSRYYPKYDNYDAINVDKISDIPYDYFGKIGVPITILEGFDYQEFDIIGIDRNVEGNTSRKRFSINGKDKYVRIIIKRKQANE